MLIPIGTMEEQTLYMYEKRDGVVQSREIGPVRFVPLLGTHGWDDRG